MNFDGIVMEESNTRVCCQQFELPASVVDTMWTADSSEYSSTVQTPCMFDIRPRSETTMCVDPPEVVTKVDDTDCDGETTAQPSSHQVYIEAGGSADLTSDDDDVLNKLMSDQQAQHVVDDSWLECWDPQQLEPVKSSHGDLHTITISPEHYEHDQQAFTNNTVTLDEIQVWAGGASRSFKYKSRPLRPILPKPTPDTVGVQTIPQHDLQSLPKKTFFVAFDKASRSATFTASGTVKHDNYNTQLSTTLP